MVRHLLESPAVLALQIEVVGVDLDGQQCMERTRTLAITRDGATILLASKLAPESELLVRNVLTDEEAVVRVVGHLREDSSGQIYGVAFLDPTVDLWHVQFPPRKSTERTVLECSHCHVVKSLSLADIEVEIFKSKRALTRPCMCSTAATIWKETDRDPPVEERRIPPRHQFAPEQVAGPPIEKRMDRRVIIKTVACIRYGGREELAECEDMSRGGFRFKSQGKYPAGTRIEAAVPYARANVNIFVPARIAYHQELSSESHRHGVEYLKTNRNTSLG
jgi:hypothetical protein